MFRKIISAVILVPLMVVVVAFWVANRHDVTVSFDPFSSAAPAYSITLQLFIVLFAALLTGVLIGGTAVWFGQRRHRRARRRLDAEVNALHREMDGMRQQLAEAPAPSRKEPEPAPPLIMPPVA